MDYETKYKEALNLVMDCVPDENGLIHVRPEDIFPELAESEDERIKKWIINEIKIKHHNLDEDNVDFVDKAIAWLEKQGKSRKEVSDKIESELVWEDKLGKKIERLKSQRMVSAEAKEFLYGKPAWSEDDDDCLSIIIAEFSKCAGKSVSKDAWMRCNDFLNSLKDRVQSQPKQELDEDTQQTTWKPSKEQMDAMQMAVSYFDYSWISKEQKLLESLYKDLKRL